jgi:hypothetical protein
VSVVKSSAVSITMWLANDAHDHVREPSTSTFAPTELRWTSFAGLSAR